MMADPPLLATILLDVGITSPPPNWMAETTETGSFRHPDGRGPCE
jgi:hypothetical protein